jgi:hypothetical protein
MMVRKLLIVLSGLAVFAIASPVVANATQPDPDHKVTICHRTNAVTNPYRIITVDEAAVDGEGGADHVGVHTGPLVVTEGEAQFFKDQGIKWGDIVPPFYADGSPRPEGSATLNWDIEGQEIFELGCKLPVETTPSPTPTPEPPVVCPEGTDNAGEEIPEGETVESFCNDDEPSPSEPPSPSPSQPPIGNPNPPTKTDTPVAGPLPVTGPREDLIFHLGLAFLGLLVLAAAAFRVASWAKTRGN